MVIVDSHQKVLLAWAECRKTRTQPPTLLTLDHHTDTSKPFRNFIKKNFVQNNEAAEAARIKLVNALDYNNLDTIALAITKLSNDEHIIAAIQSDIISSALVIAHNARDTDLQTYREHKIICRSVDRAHNSRALEVYDYDKVLETSFLNDSIAGFNSILLEAKESKLQEREYILDIDLDYFNTTNSISPHDSRTIKELAKNASLITIATEPEYVRSCAIDANLSYESLLAGLLEVLN